MEVHNYPVGALLVSEQMAYVLTDYHGTDTILYRITEDKCEEALLERPEGEYSYLMGTSLSRAGRLNSNKEAYSSVFWQEYLLENFLNLAW